jgi:hypothetical protein
VSSYLIVDFLGMLQVLKQVFSVSYVISKTTDKTDTKKTTKSGHQQD